MKYSVLRCAAFALAILVSGCSDDPVTVNDTSVAGVYTATTFTFTELGTVTNVLTAGGSMTITLGVDGTTSGTLVIPASLDLDGGVNGSMAGTYHSDNGSVTFTQSADTFIRTMTFTKGTNTLTSTKVFTGVSVNIVLTRP